MTNKVTVTEEISTVTVTEADKTVTVEVPKTSVVTAVTQGPTGASGLNLNIVDTDKITGSLVYWNGSAYKADETTTKSSLVDGGNF
tara:strand:- start:255 stop:512 length:258 start_codon:yes stop_codon:yes gene_type:complete